MTVSVVISVYNTERYVAAAIDSVLAQTRAPSEVIVVDDGSTDRTPDILRGYGDRIVVLRQRQSGPATALNAGIAKATGTLLAFQDADDLWVVNKLELQAAVLAREPEIDAVFGATKQFISPDLGEEDRNLLVPAQEQRGAHKGAMLIRRSTFDRIGPFDETLRYVEFIDWYGRALAFGLRTHFLDDIVMHRRIHATNTGRTYRAAQREENMAALKRLLDLRRQGSG